MALGNWNLTTVEITHNFGKKILTRTAIRQSEPTLMLGQEGSYLWIGDHPASRYQGWYFRLGSNLLLKIIDDIRSQSLGQVLSIENGFNWVKRTGQKVSEKFSLFGNNCLVYESSAAASVEVFLDVREPYQNPEFGRHYRVWREGKIIFINYYQETPFLLPQIFIAIGGDTDNAEVKEEWVRRDYDYDRRRGSAPWEKWVFKPAVFSGSKLYFAAGATKDEAGEALGQILNRKGTKSANGGGQNLGPGGGFWQALAGGRSDLDGRAAAVCAKNALKMLYSQRRRAAGLRAGLPWFFQFWQRDEAVSLKGLAQFDEKTAMEIFWRQMEEFKNGKYFFDTADGAGWLFLRAADFINRGKFNIKENAVILTHLEKGIDRLLNESTIGGLAVEAGRTWMDSLERPGAAIEIQALRLNMYALAQSLAVDKKTRDRYAAIEAELACRVKKMFFDGRTLADRYDIAQNCADRTMRPNIFLAAYVYPKLLARAEWEAGFDAALEKLWLDWGGMATIDKNDPRFRAQDTGQDAAAYHNGDSWFWVSNIAAIVMSRVNRKKYNNKIDKIWNAAKNDILWGGTIGCASEISSAESYYPCGCPNQAWSNATFLELCQELKK